MVFISAVFELYSLYKVTQKKENKFNVGSDIMTR